MTDHLPREIGAGGDSGTHYEGIPEGFGDTLFNRIPSTRPFPPALSPLFGSRLTADSRQLTAYG
jgi:hypothetical protein